MYFISILSFSILIYLTSLSLSVCRNWDSMPGPRLSLPLDQLDKGGRNTHRNNPRTQTGRVKQVLHGAIGAQLANCHLGRVKYRNVHAQFFATLFLVFKGSASQLKQVGLKNSPHIQKLSGTDLFPKCRHQYIYQLSKNPCTSCFSNHSWFPTTRASTTEFL